MRYIALALCLATIPLGGGPVYAHSWYPYDCCSDRDCWPMGLDSDAREPDPSIVPGGYLTYDGVFVPESATRASLDGRYHICRRGGTLTGTVIAPAQKPFCLFVPKPAY